jgi:hypothetical protein
MTSIFADAEVDLRADPSVPVREPAPGAGPPDSKGAGLDLSIFGEIALHLKSLADSTQRDQDRRDRLAAAIPSDEQLSVAGVFPASGNLILDLGSVPVGRVWQVRRIILGGTKVTTTGTGTAYAFAQGAAPVDLNTLNAVDIWSSFSTGAQGSTYSTHTLWLPERAHLWIAFVGMASGMQCVASAQVEDFDAEAYASALFTE